MITRSNHIHLEGKLLWDMVTISTVLKCIAFTGQKNCSRNGLTVTMLYFTVGVIIEVPCSPQQMNMFFSVKKNNALCWPVHFSFTNALSIPHRGGGGPNPDGGPDLVCRPYVLPTSAVAYTVCSNFFHCPHTAGPMVILQE